MAEGEKGSGIDFKSLDIKDLPRLLASRKKAKMQNVSGQMGKYEVNLVPAVKLKMIHMQKIRNLVLFICIVIAVACGGIVAVLGSIKVGQDVAIAVQDGHLKKLSETVFGYDELSEFLTIQKQLDMIQKVEDNKKVLSRVFGILGTLMPNKDDKISISELSVNLKETTFAFDAQADAGKEPLIDYRVLEAFKKAVSLMKYDYGRYVDADGNEIPSRCIIETGEDGNLLTDKGSIYAIWTRGRTGCDPSRDDFDVDENGNIVTKSFTFDEASSSLDNTELTGLEDDGIARVKTDDGDEEDDDERSSGNKNKVASDKKATDDKKANDDKTSEEDEKKNVDVVPNERIWRTPQFNAWHNGERVTTADDGVDDDIANRASEANNNGNISRNVRTFIYTPEMTVGTGESEPSEISGVPHFESKCITYFGKENDDNTVQWSAENDCMMVPEEIVINDSSNGRDQSGNLVLRFSTAIKFNEAVFSYNNKHMMVISPTSQNVTDSYVQVENMFAAPATDCAPDDVACNDKTNETGEK